MAWVSIVVVAGFVIVAVIILITGVRGIAEWISNSSKPVLTERARVTGKRTHVSGGGQHSQARTNYYVTFELAEDGSRHEFRVSGKAYGRLSERDEGELTYQGTRYVGFSRG
jgi:hypothetical protein